MIPKKMDQQAASTIKSILQKLNINNPRVLIDLEKQTVEAQEDDYSVDDLLEAAGALTPERGKELLEEVNKSREEWNA
jgi:sulfur carrier protein ThiS